MFNVSVLKIFQHIMQVAPPLAQTCIFITHTVHNIEAFGSVVSHEKILHYLCHIQIALVFILLINKCRWHYYLNCTHQLTICMKYSGILFIVSNLKIFIGLSFNFQYSNYLLSSSVVQPNSTNCYRRMFLKFSEFCQMSVLRISYDFTKL